MEDRINIDWGLHLSMGCVVAQLQNSVVGCQLAKSGDYTH
jgi:hypothetical protein